MAMKDKGSGGEWRNNPGSDQWRGSPGNMGGGGGPGSHDDMSHGHSSEYGANFRDSSMQGGDRPQYGRYGSNERFPTEGEWNGYGTQERYGRGERYWPGEDSNRQYGADYGNRSYSPGSEYGRHSTSIPEYDSSYGARGMSDAWRMGSSPHSGEDWHMSRHGGRHESMMQKVGRFFGIGPKGYKRSDTRIQEDVSDALMDDAFVDATHIEVIVKDAELTLEGWVDDRTTKRRAEDVSGTVRGVKDVHNHLRVRPLSQSTMGNALGQESTMGPNGSPVTGDKKNDKSRSSPVS